MSIKLMTLAWDMEIPSGPKLVLLALCDNANDQGECYPSIGKIAKKCSMSERSVFTHIDWLERGGALYRENRKGRSSIYHLDPCKFLTPENISDENSAHPPANSAHPPANLAPITITKSSNNPKSSSSDKSSEPESPVDTELQSACKATWESYRASYLKRYGIDPLRNAAVNVAIKSFCQKIPFEEAPHVAAFYVGHDGRYYVQKTHPATLLNKDAEGLRTQWATGKKVTDGTEKFDPLAYVNKHKTNGGRREIVIDHE